MAAEMHIPWYATGLRGDQLQAALLATTPTALRYGASAWSLHRSQDDRYKFLQIVRFEDKIDFERWWQGTEMTEFRAMTSGWWQVPILYTPHDLVGAGHINVGGDANEAAGAPAPESDPAGPEPATAA